MISKELLHRNRDYVLSHMEDLHYLSTPSPMFVDGKFSEDNWNGGDGVIRQFLSEVERSDDWRQVYKNEDLVMIVDYKIYEDDHYVDIVCLKTFYNKVNIDKYSFSWYKHRGRTDTATRNGKTLAQTDYIKLLNDIEKITSFKFKFY